MRLFMSKCYDDFTKEELIKLLHKQDEELTIKKYGLTWDSEKEPEQVVLDCENNLPILKRIADKEIKTDNSDYNILIEGDNYHALTVLNYTHKEKIDVIYIDPPYNKGDKDFVYNDRFINKDDGYLHSKWLNFMEKRLMLAKNLLKNTGAIFISIDEDEHSNLKLLCDKIFNEDNFVGNLIWRKKSGGGQSDDFFVTEHEYILVYAKNKKLFSWIDEEQEKAIDNYNKIDKFGNRYKLTKLEKWGNNARKEDRPTMYFPILTPDKKEYYPIDPHGNDGRWRVGKNKMDFLIANNLVYWDTNNDKLVPKEIEYYDENNNLSVLKARSVLYDLAETTDGTNALTRIFGEKDKFNNPKPVELIKFILKHSISQENAMVLDFFAGSGTTAHAVLEYNQEQDTNLNFVVCTNNENLTASLKLQKDLKMNNYEFNDWKEKNEQSWQDFINKNGICTSVTYPRIKKVIEGYKYSGKYKKLIFEKKINKSDLTPKKIEKFLATINDIKSSTALNVKTIDEFKNNTYKIFEVNDSVEQIDGLGGNLQYYKTDLIPVEKIDKINDSQRAELTSKAGEMIAIKENCFNQVELNDYYQIFENNTSTKRTAIYFREDVSEFDELVNKISDTKTTLYIFSYGRIDKKIYSYLNDNITIEDIPEPILEIYKEINLTLKD